MLPFKEPLEIDFYVDPRPMTKEDERAISEYIKADKIKRAKSAKKKNTTRRSSFLKDSQKNKV